MLLSYSDYQTLGGTLSENDFILYENLAEYDVKSIAGGALPDTSVLNSCLMLLISAYVKSDNLSSEHRATSYSNDGVSVSLEHSETPENVIKTAQERVRIIFANNGIYPKCRGVRHRE